jgi:predicted phage tail protein
MSALSVIGHKGGGKGGGGGARTPVEERDSLRSLQYAEILDLIGEGEMQGLVNGLRSVYFDRVPLQNADGTMNFEGVEFAASPGTQGQPALSGFDTLQNEVAVSVQVRQATPIVRSISAPGINRVRVTLSVPALGKTNTSNGDMSGTEVTCNIAIQNNGGGYVVVKFVNFIGKTNSKYQRASVIDLPGSGPWDIRVTRSTPDASSSTVQDAVFWDSYTEIQSVKLRYPNSVVHGLRVSAQQFSRIPERAYDMMGLRMQIPSNYDPLTRVYTGSWNGTFKIGWTNNPAWVYYLLCTHPRFGLGEFIDAALIDKWELYRIAQYSDALVPDGRGGVEPRFTCNIVIQAREEAYKVLQDIAALFRGMSYWNAGAVQFSQDAPSAPEVLFSPANVLEGDFTYASTSANVRHSMAVVYWNNPEDFFKRVPEVVVDDALVAKYGIRQLELSPVGITSRGQAARIGKWALLSEDVDAETISFSTGMEGGGVRMGRVFKVADPSEAGERLGGRIRVATTSAVTIDSPVTISVGQTYTLTVMYPDTTLPMGYKTEERSVTNGAGIHSTLNVAPAFSQAPVGQTTWVLASNLVNPTLWRCISVKELSPEKYEIVGVSHNPSKYNAIELGLKLETKPVSTLSALAITPVDLKFTEALYLDRSTYKSRLTVGWVPAAAAGAAAQRYNASWRFNGGPWTQLSEMTEASMDIAGLEPGLIDVSIRSVNNLGNRSLPLSGSYTLLGKLAPPAAMTNLSLTVSNNGVLATWDDPSSVDPDWQAAELAFDANFTNRVTYKRSTTHLIGWLQAGLRTLYGRHWDEERSSLEAAAASINIFAPAAPVANISVKKDFLELRWQDCTTSQPIELYEMKQGLVEASAQLLGTVSARFKMLFVQASGTYRYWVRAKDVAGNYGAWDYVDAVLSNPPGYSVIDNRNLTWDGTKTNAIKTAISTKTTLDMLVNTTRTLGQRSAAYPTGTDKINAGQVYLFQPSAATAQYEEIIDYLAPVSGTVATLAWQQDVIGTPDIIPTLSTKTLIGDPWVDYVGQYTCPIAGKRYLKVTLNATSSGGADLAMLRDGTVSVTTQVESKTVTLDITDTTTPAGQRFLFSNIMAPGWFDVVNSGGYELTTPNSLTQQYFYTRDADPNPLGINIGINNPSGVRITGTVTLTVTGVKTI